MRLDIGPAVRTDGRAGRSELRYYEPERDTAEPESAYERFNALASYALYHTNTLPNAVRNQTRDKEYAKQAKSFCSFTSLHWLTMTSRIVTSSIPKFIRGK